MATTPPDTSYILKASQPGWTPAIQIELEKNLTSEQITASRDALTPAQKTLLNKYLELTQTKAVPKTSIRIVDKATARADALLTKTEAEKKAAEEANKKKVKDLQATTETKEEAIDQTFKKELEEIDAKIRLASPQEQPALYLEKEQLKEERDADLRELAQENVQELKDLEDELWLEKDHIKEELEADKRELAQEDPRALAILDIKENGWTPEKQLAVEDGLPFEEWGEERKKLTGDQIEDIEAYTQGLTPVEWTPEGQLEKEEGMTFEQWGEERKKLTPDQIYDVEAYTQGLEEPEEEAAPPEEGERLTPALEEAERKTMEQAGGAPAPPAPELLITRTNYPKWWKDSAVARISLSDAGSQTVIPARAGFRIYVASITFFVSGETNVTLTFGIFGQSGSMDFGGSDEPRGMTANMGDSPAPCGQGGFTITSDGSGTSVGGYVVYYIESEKEKR